MLPWLLFSLLPSRRRLHTFIPTCAPSRGRHSHTNAQCQASNVSAEAAVSGGRPKRSAIPGESKNQQEVERMQKKPEVCQQQPLSWSGERSTQAAPPTDAMPEREKAGQPAGQPSNAVQDYVDVEHLRLRQTPDRDKTGETSTFPTTVSCTTQTPQEKGDDAVVPMGWLRPYGYLLISLYRPKLPLKLTTLNLGSSTDRMWKNLLGSMLRMS